MYLLFRDFACHITFIWYKLYIWHEICFYLSPVTDGWQWSLAISYLHKPGNLTHIFLPIFGSSMQKSERESSLMSSTLPTFQLRTVRGNMAMGPNTYIPLLSRKPIYNHETSTCHSTNNTKALHNPQGTYNLDAKGLNY